ncbi:MAG: ABC transporter substrate-binding protein [Acetobacteraceae bacterium]|nr:ABC transporter substrate-binding protein [Acetobacteraceae bacterium]
MKRRSLLTGAAAVGVAAATGLPRPALSQAARRELKFVPQANLANPDPVWTTTIVAANHAHMVWDQLWNFDEGLIPQPQMLAGATTSADRLTWTLTLRDGQTFHDGEKVLSRDCVASLTRWMKRDGMGQRINGQMNEMKVVDDKTFQISLKKPFALIPMAFANNCHMMPERMAKTDAFQQITEYVGSGPFRFLRDEWVSGSKAVYVKNEKYVPRSEKPSNMAGAKVVNLDRVEWHITGDPSSAAAAIQKGEVDWIEQPLADLLPVLAAAPGVVVETTDLFGNIGLIRFNHLHPPFNNMKLRQAVLAMVDQKDFLAAIMGADSKLTQAGVGVFTPGTPLASDAGMEKLNGKRDLAAARKLVAESGYNGERVVIMAPTDFAVINAMAQVTAQICRDLGLNVDYVATDWGALVQRRASREPVEKGGWSIFCTYGDGFTFSNPAVYTALWGMGEKAWFGWYKSDRMEALRDAWYEAPDLATQQKLGREMQALAMEEVPFVPLGLWRQPIARRSNVHGILKATRPLFWNITKT